jgi:cyclopropane fatty-acyl-phospholipid synthase-like methyltransferase
MFTRDPKEEVAEFYKNECYLAQIAGEEVPHLHQGYWYPDTDVHDLKTAQYNYLQELVKNIPRPKGDVILDLGCGYGAAAIWLATHFACRVYAIDLLESHIAKAKTAIQKYGLQDKIELHLADILDTDFLPDTFAHVLAVESLYHIAQKEKVFAKVQKSLKKGGLFAIADYLLYAPCSWLSAKIAPLASGGSYIGYASEYSDLLQKCGFTIIGIEDVTEQTLLKTFLCSQSENHDHLRDYVRKNHGVVASFIIPRIFKACMAGPAKKHWGVSFIWARKD